MPKSPNASFKANSLNVKRMKAWIEAGAPDN
jgi:hypothetical protein